MTERRLRAGAPLPAVGERLVLASDVAHHARVLRLDVGDAITLFDGRGHEAAATIASLEPLTVTIAAVHTAPTAQRGPVLVQCLPKGKKLDEIVRGATEIGVSAIHLALSSRTIARPDEARALDRLDRLQRIVDEAVRQSEAPIAPDLHAPASLLEVARRAPADAPRLVLSPREGRPFVEALGAGSSPAWLLVGPEGGLDDAETKALTAAGWTLARIDAWVMRTETAGLAAIAIARATRSAADGA